MPEAPPVINTLLCFKNEVPSGPSRQLLSAIILRANEDIQDGYFEVRDKGSLNKMSLKEHQAVAF